MRVVFSDKLEDFSVPVSWPVFSCPVGALLEYEGLLHPVMSPVCPLLVWGIEVRFYAG